MTHVITTISLSKEQARFLRESGYSPSRLIQNQVSKLMKKSEGRSLQAQPSDESPLGDSNV